MIISGGFIDCVLTSTGNDINGQSYSDYSHHRWTITGSSGPIAGSNPINGTPVQATWQLITGNGHHDSITPGNASRWTRNPCSGSAPLVVYSSGNTVVLQRSSTLNSVMNAFTVQTGSTTQPGNVDEIGLVGLLGSNPVVPMQTGLEWSSSLQGSFSSPIVIVHFTRWGKGGFRTSFSFPWNVGLTDTDPNDIQHWFYQRPASVPASAWWRWTINF
jgi:hypothetical protein